MSLAKHQARSCAIATMAFGMVLMFGPSLRAEPVLPNQPDPARGATLTKSLCSNCHLVSEDQAKAVADVPSFAEIANAPDQTADAIMARIILPKHPMPKVALTRDELRDVSAYIMSLRKK